MRGTTTGRAMLASHLVSQTQHGILMRSAEIGRVGITETEVQSLMRINLHKGRDRAKARALRAKGALRIVQSRCKINTARKPTPAPCDGPRASLRDHRSTA